ncbi:hypothetical protein ACP6PL_25125 [Dapis sp. BLCC M126]|uniref:hypothetical protein n=1 Tax=Dapis sp. BLCC M126 TaxID=3400189 RepID=UPI003CF14847
MGSRVEERDNNLSRVNYLPILKGILQILQGNEKTQKESAFFLDKDNRLTLLAERITGFVIELSKQKPDDFPPPLRGSTKSASVNFAHESLFRENIRKIQKELKLQLDEILKIKQDNPESIQKWQEHFLSSLEKFVEAPGFFNFSIEQERQLNLQRINTDNVKANESAQKHFRGKIRIKIPTEFDQHLLAAIHNELNRENGFYSSCDEDEIDRLNDLYDDISEDGDSRINNLKKLIQEEITGKIRADISLEFLEIFIDKIPNAKKQGEGYELLVDFLHRLKEFDDFLSRDIHTVSLFGNDYKLQDLFGRGDKWDFLPVKVKIEDRQAEGLDKTKEWHEFTYAIDFKLNGRTNYTSSKNVFEHNCKLLNPESEEGYKSEIKKRGNDNKRKAGFYGKLVKIIFLYCFIFYEFDNSKESQEKVVERIFQRLSTSTTEAEQIQFLTNFSSYLKEQSQAEIKLTKIVSYIKNICSEKNAAWQTIQIDGYLSLRKGLLKHPSELNEILDNESFLTDELSQKNQSISFKSALQFLKFVKDRDENNLYDIQVKVEIDDIRYKLEGEAETGKFTLVNDGEYQHLLVMFVERTELLKLWVSKGWTPIQKLQLEQLQKILPGLTKEEGEKIISGKQKFDIKKIQPRKTLINYPKSVVVTYDSSRQFTNLESEVQSIEDRRKECFYYQIVYSIIVILGILVLSERLSITKNNPKERIKTFISLFRSQSSSAENSTSFDTFIATFCKDLELVLDIEQSILCSTQGLDISTPNKYKNNNARLSLYSKLPSQVQLEKEIDFLQESKIDKVGIIVVSSHECDAQHQGDEKKSIVFGRVYTITRQNTLFEIKSFGSFCKCEFSNKRFASSIVVDQVSRLDKAGYKHIFYVSKTPYQDKFNFSLADEEKDDDTERLFFMNSEVIKQMKAVNNSITIYPVFVSNYRIFDLKRSNKDKGCSYYLGSVEDVSKIEPLTINAAAFLNLYNLEEVGKNNSYNSVISYACPINIYAADVLENREIIHGLFAKDTNTSDRDTLFLFMVMLHYAKNEKFGEFPTIKPIKLNPYKDIFEEVGYKSTKFYHPQSSARFNLLAFVYEVFNSVVG